ncbi:MAG: exodeoxyribonuclease VII small subunit [Christensenellales bacterium]
MGNTSFEKSLAELEAIASRLESGGLGLEESIELLEKGMGIAAQCEKKLEESRKKITVLTAGKETSFEPEDADERI